jgi:hypothetical protein
MVWKYHTLSEKVFNWKFRKAALFNRTYNKFEDLVERGFERIAMAADGF